MAIVRKDNTVSLKTNEITTILGKGSEFEGKLQFEGTLRIEGSFSGEIHSDSILMVDEGARVNAEVDVGTIIINGEVTGNIRAKQSVEIRAPGKVIGNIRTPALIIESGVIFEGSCKMENLNKGSKEAVFTASPTPPEIPAEKKPSQQNAPAS